jgi:O-antigen/teichoic acid export membrane protein
MNGAPPFHQSRQLRLGRPIFNSMKETPSVAGIVSLKRRLLAGGAWALLGRVVMAASGFATNILISRMIAPADFGAYFLLLSMTSIAVQIAQGGMQIGVVRLVAEAKGRDEPGKIVGIVLATLRTGAMTGALLGAIGGLFTWWAGVGIFESSTMSNAAGFVPLWVLMLTLTSLIGESFRGMHHYSLASVCAGMGINVLLLTILLLLTLGSIQIGLTGLLSIYLAALAGTLIAGGLLMRTQLARLGQRARVTAIELLRLGWPLMVSSAAILVMTQTDLWLMGALLNPTEVAVYGAAARVVALVMMPMLIVNTVLPPLIADLNGRGELIRIERTARAISAAASIPAILILISLSFIAGPLLTLAYGEFYRPGAQILLLLSAGQTINVITGSGATILMMVGGQHLVMIISIICCTLLLIVGYFAAITFGANGVATTAAACTALHGVLCLGAVRHRYRIWTHAGFDQLGSYLRALRAYRA